MHFDKVNFKIRYIRRRFRFIPRWKVQVEITGIETLDRIEELCDELTAAGAEKLNYFWWEDPRSCHIS